MMQINYQMTNITGFKNKYKVFIKKIKQISIQDQ